MQKVIKFRSSSQMVCIGYGLVPPKNAVDLITCMICMLTGSCVFAAFIAKITAHIQTIDVSRRAYGLDF